MDEVFGRHSYAAYAAFVIDRDGNNIEAVIWEGEPGTSDRNWSTGTKRRKRSG